MFKKIIINTDGGSRGNPGIAGAGAVISDEEGTVIKKVCRPLGIMTNNEAEYQAVILGIETAKKTFGKEKLADMEVEMRMDSELVCRQLRGEYQIKEEKLHPLFIKIWNMRVADFPKISFNHVRREQNKLADIMANEAMDNSPESCGSKLF